ncbi:MAG: carbon-nitrogen hydrolase family protein [Acidobacteria bacterium]|nr:carbon-nitrogen hydrolase family protein [Acidobacteriota bacterium]
MPQSIVVVAAVQAAPIYMNLERSLARAIELIAEAARRRSQLVVFPESWLPGYPAWLDTCRDVARWDHPPMKRLYSQLMDNSVVVPGPVTEELGEAARRHNLTLVMGVHERVNNGAGRGTIYNSILTFGPTGELLNVHRKLVPTFNERLIWGAGDGRGLKTVETPVGKIGGLICWEHWMPHARQALHIGGEDIHVALWPSVKEMHQIASRHYAFEGRCFVVAAGSIMRRSDLPAELELADSETGEDSELILNGGSAVIGPDGQYVAGPAFGSEVIILARINLERIREESMVLDVTGHFNRPDIFDFRLKESDSRKDSIHLVPAASDELLHTSTEVLIQPSTEVLLPPSPDSPPPLRVISSPRQSGGFDSDFLGVEKRSGQSA